MLSSSVLERVSCGAMRAVFCPGALEGLGRIGVHAHHESHRVKHRSPVQRDRPGALGHRPKAGHGLSRGSVTAHEAATPERAL